MKCIKGITVDDSAIALSSIQKQRHYIPFQTIVSSVKPSSGGNHLIKDVITEGTGGDQESRKQREGTF
ncbi:hypothetical protein QJS10_CPB17g01126 [Acorus calamus]|uniref:Uncharacterized protein n=1 Tax=Acorus calamus TaxID=4465 RepID=A0AAV9CYS1_ACOCL|nr:hypothetical protein QJS10_CPB17g01126 [Acorus calamus]